MSKIRSFGWLPVALALTVSGAARASSDDDGDSGGSVPATDASGATNLEPDENGIINTSFGQGLQLGDPVEGGEIHIGLESTVDTLDPLRGITGGQIVVSNMLYDNLLRLGNDLTIEPGVALGIEPNDDLTVWTLTLPTDVTFSDGTPYDADAVVAHWTRLGAEGSPSRFAAQVGPIEAVAEDPETVVFTLPEPSAVFPVLLTNSEPSWVPSPTAVEAAGEGFTTNPVGAGPFMIEGSFTPGNTINMVKNPDYRVEGEPYLDAVQLTTIIDTEARFAGLLSGDLDVTVSTTPAQYTRAEESGLRVLTAEPTQYSNMVWNIGRPPFDDARFRQAVIMGTDLETMSAAVFDGALTPAAGVILPSDPFYADVGFPTYDPDGARALVEEFVADGGDPSFVLTVGSPPDYQRQGAILQQMLAEVGIDVEIEIGEQAPMIAEGISGEYTAQLRRGGVSGDVRNMLYQQFLSGAANNLTHAENPELDALLNELYVTTDPEDIRSIVEEVQVEFAEFLPYFPMITLSTAYIMNDRIAGFPAPGIASNQGAGGFDITGVWLAG